MLSENEKWLLSFYRSSEINGALFFGRLARTVRSGPIQMDMTRHFADEAQHSRWWTDCIEACGFQPEKLKGSYQDSYLDAGGMPTNLMEVLAVTLVFERRVVGQYAAHVKVPDLAAPIRDTLAKIMNDEKWHIQWVSGALRDMETKFGKETVESTVKRYTDADREVYKAMLEQHEAIMTELATRRGRAPMLIQEEAVR